MASINWKKANVQMAGAMSKHFGREERVALNHSNQDIDKSKSHLNIYIGADDYAPMVEKVKARIEQVDKEHPPLKVTKDRVTCFMLEIPVPQAITEQGKAEEFLLSSHKLIEEFFGAENVGGTCGHFDEQHQYLDKDGNECMSLAHGHTLVAAYVEWTEDVKKNVKQDNGKYKQVKTGETRERVGINGKHCESKARLTALNKAMDDMCRRDYGISYNTGGVTSKESVEHLKRKSALKAEEKAVKRQVEFQQELLADNREWNRLAEEEYFRLEGENAVLEEQIEQSNLKLSNVNTQLDSLEGRKAVALRNVVKDFKGNKTRKAAQAIIDNAEDISQSLTAEAEADRAAAAQARQNAEGLERQAQLHEEQALLKEKRAESANAKAQSLVEQQQALITKGIKEGVTERVNAILGRQDTQIAHNKAVIARQQQTVRQGTRQIYTDRAVYQLSEQHCQSVEQRLSELRGERNKDNERNNNNRNTSRHAGR